ncbi:hypothetical protein ACWF94_17100 [Streptomyces sp. NPDC055078]
MTRITVPGQTTQEPDRAWARAPVEPAASEACRYLCAGVHIDGHYRDAVIEELYVHEERFTAPSFGIDAARVLAHALQARRNELGWALGVLTLWVLAIPLTDRLFLLFLVPSLVLTLVAGLGDTLGRAPAYFRLIALGLKWVARCVLAVAVPGLLIFGVAGLISGDGDTGDVGTGGGDSSGEVSSGGVSSEAGSTGGSTADGGFPTGAGWDYPQEPSSSSSDDGSVLDFLPLLDPGSAKPGHALLAVFLFFLITALVGFQRGHFARVMTGPLSPARFPDVAGDPAETAPWPRARRLLDLVRREQHSPLVMYHPADPFLGAGDAFETWTIAVELRPREDREPVPLDNRAVMDRIKLLVEALQVPSSHGSPQAAEAVRDRLRELRVDEFVFLPAEGLTSRDGAPYHHEGFEAHCRDAVEEGGEARRHFLRIRVGGWEEEVVVTVFVRVHTQGGMLMLEIAPHVLLPVNPAFREADRVAHRYANNSALGKFAWALAHTPRSTGQSALTVGRWMAGRWRQLTGGHRDALPDGPALSVREYGSATGVSLFQKMDAVRYLRSIQDRVAEAVSRALDDAGWQTDKFEQKIVNYIGGNHIGSVDNSALTFGANSTATTTNTTHAATDPAQQALLAAVRELRADLARFTAAPAAEVLDAELVAAEEEIAASGAVGRGRLERLRGGLASAGDLVAALGSGVAVAELVAALLGG